MLAEARYRPSTVEQNKICWQVRLRRWRPSLFVGWLWAISNATSGGTEQQIAFLVNQGVIPPLCSFLKQLQQRKITMVTLEGLENILKVGKAQADRNGTGIIWVPVPISK